MPFLVNQKPCLDYVPMTTLYGVDVSHYQHYIEWDTVAARRAVDFAFVKATEGHDYADSLFSRNWEELGRLGIRRGAYHFFRAYGCGEDQARHFLSTVKMQPGDLAPVLDIERNDDMPPEVMREEAAIWLKTVESTLGIKPIIYTSQNFFDHFLAGYFDDYPLWVARYSDEKPVLVNGKRWHIWQFANDGCIDGIPRQVDLNTFIGNAAQLEQFCWRPKQISVTMEPVIP